MNCAASAPSLTRWSTEIVAFIRQPGLISPFSTTGTSRAEPTSQDRGFGWIDDRDEVFHVVHAQIGNREGRAFDIIRLDLPSRAPATMRFTSAEIGA